ncbi:nucleoside diphosphate kinase regulator [Dongia sp.]|uniref:nucleoside diphosphate kinase regulator n=1 Tax=Dongia sp. TaxID=1977262 RepID=UPI003751DAFE
MSMKDKATARAGQVKPRILLTAEDYDRLSDLARAAADAMPDQVAVLTEELERAEIVAVGRPEETVCMGAEVTFRDDSTGKVETITLVYPGDADISRRRISVMTPIGTALIGLATGQSITWATRSGEVRLLTVLDVGLPQLA